MKSSTNFVDANGDGFKDAPNILGCYLCHTQGDRNNTTDKMKDVSLDFGNQASMHDIGRRISDSVNTNNEFQSNWTGNALVGWTGGTNVPNELQCVWCHNVTGSTYPDHNTPTSGNPKFLYNVTTATDLNDFCYSRCHVGTSFANGGSAVAVQPMGHIGWASFSNGGTAAKGNDSMKTARGTAIKTADCAVCHNSHSSNKLNMIRDGNASESGTAIDETNCIAVCHNTPAKWATSITGGHGQFSTFSSPPNDLSCGPCHTSGVSHRYYDPGPPEVKNPKRFAFPEDTSQSTIAYDGSSDGLDNDFDGKIDAADTVGSEATWTYPQESMCRGCHSTYKAHGGNISDDATSGFASCLDCHDPHGTNVGPTNIKMIRGLIGPTAGGKTQVWTVFQGAADYYKNPAGTGICDNVNCHGASMFTILNNPLSPGYAQHTDYGVVPGTNCKQCHGHPGPASFKAQCNTCHGYPPTTGAHTKHRIDLGYSCYECHYGNTHNQGLFAPGDFIVTPDVDYTDFYDAAGKQYSRFQVQVGFNPALFNSDANNGTLAAPSFVRGATSADLTCLGLACHNPDNVVTGKVQAADETNNIPIWGQTYDLCTDCHAKSINAADPAGKSHKAHDVTKGYACTICHADVNVGPTGPGRLTHGNKNLDSGQVVFGGDLGPIHLNGTYDNNTDTCGNVYCHGNFTGGTLTPPPDWNLTATGACGTCHGATAATPPQGNTHPQHTGNIQTNPAERQYAYTCNYCHYTTMNNTTTISNPARHVNGSSEFAFDPTIPRLTGATYGGTATVGDNATDGNDKCLTLYCHGTGNAGRSLTGGTTVASPPEWNVQATGACGTCHGATAANPPQTPTATGGHQTHSGNSATGDYAYPCSICHVATTANGTNIVSPPTPHVNGSANVVFNTADPRLAGTVAGDYHGTPTLNDWVADGGDTCTNTYCHSQGVSFTSPFGTQLPALQWEQTSTCASCHGNGPAYVDGTPKANKHAAHVTINGIACTTCHSWFGDAVQTRQLHVNGSYNPQSTTLNTLDDFGYTYNSPGGNCTAVNCHGGSAVSWNANMTAVPWNANNNHYTCNICHSYSAGVVTNTDVNSYTINVSSPTAAMSKVSASEFTTFGHGLAANGGKACKDCHDSTVGHEMTPNLNGGVNPFRLRDLDANAGNGLTFSCMYDDPTAGTCHDTGLATDLVGVDYQDIRSHSAPAMLALTPPYNPKYDVADGWSFAPDCVNCHDPHGDGANISMIQGDLFDQAAFNLPTQTPPTVSTGMTFTNNNLGVGTGSYAWTTTAAPNYSGICQECHEGTTTTYVFVDGVSATNASHTAATDCTPCHGHEVAFKPSGCNGCHGGGNNSTVANNYWPDGLTGGTLRPEDQENTTGIRHQKHMEDLALRVYGQTLAQLLADTPLPLSDEKQKKLCAYCHPDSFTPDYDPTTALTSFTDNHNIGTGTVQVGGIYGHRIYDTYGTPFSNTLGLPATDAWVFTPTAVLTDGSCSLVDCHNNKTTDVTPTGAGSAGYGWYDTTATGCIMCHSDVLAVGDISHTAHTSNATATTFGYKLVCIDCHGTALDFSPSPGTPPSAGHINGSYTVGSNLVRGAAYTIAYNTVTDTCGTNICHNRGYSLAGPVLVAPRTSPYTWGTSITGCDACHDTLPTGPTALTTFSHTNHLQTTTGGASAQLCGNCHISVANNPKHLNASVDMGGLVTDAMYLGNRAVMNPASYGGCGTNTCHNNGQLTVPDASAYTWATPIGTPALNSCDECHGNTAALMTTQTHQAHLNASLKFGINITCTSCHGTNAQQATTHANGTVNFLAGGVAFTYGVAADVVVQANGGTFASCGTNACHNDGMNGPPVVNPIWSATGQPDCTICHQDGVAMVTYAHNEHLRFPTPLCTDCHTAVVSPSTTHINASLNVDTAKVTLSGATAGAVALGTVNGTCLTAGCHNKTVGVGQSAAWNIVSGSGSPGTNDLLCDACHYWSATPNAVDAASYAGGGANAMSASHGDHFTKGKSCAQCHAAVATTAHINASSNTTNAAVAVLGEAAVSFGEAVAVTDYTYTPATHACTPTSNNGLGCHATGSPDWDLAFSDCTTYCHTNTTTLAVNPTSGLHGTIAGSMISSNPHDGSFQATPGEGTPSGTCASCHTTAPTNPAASHQNGVFDASIGSDDTVLPEVNLAGTVGFIDSATPTCGPNGGLNLCHRDSNYTVVRNGTAVTAAWARLWSNTADNTGGNPDERCQNCHGTYFTAQSWRAGVIHKAGTPDMLAKHGSTSTSCNDCHAYNDGAVYTQTYITGAHGNGSITMNDNAAGTYSGWARGTGLDAQKSTCVKCHPDWANATYYFSKTWTNTQEIAGHNISTSCGECHAGGVTATTTSQTHAAHGLSHTTIAADEAKCEQCHPTMDYTLYTGTHQNLVVNLDAAKVNYATGNKTCNTASCHNYDPLLASPTKDRSEAWDTASALVCDDCHYYASGTTATAVGANGHARPLSADHGVHFGAGGTSFSQCSTCHGTDPVAGDTTHINGLLTLADKSVATPDEANVTVTTWNDTTNTCANVACHNPSGTTYSAIWQTSLTGCDLCHSSTNPGTGDHTGHITRSAVFGRAIGCVDCHTYTGYTTRHLNGAKNVQVRNTAGTFGTILTPTVAGACGTNECHNDGLNGPPLAGGYLWGNVTTITDCLECHQNGAAMATNSHNEHLRFPSPDCKDCHTPEGTVAHLNRSLNVDTAKVTLSGATGGAVALGTVNGTCLTASCHNKTAGVGQSAAWNTSSDLLCDACHYWSATPSAAGAAGYAGGGANALSASHGDHFTKGKSCAQCHAAVATTLAHINASSTTTNAAVAVLGEAAVSFGEAVAVTDYSYTPATHGCASATNNGLGCHATGSPDWDPADNAGGVPLGCTNCHTNTTTLAVNPTSGLHGTIAGSMISSNPHDGSFQATPGEGTPSGTCASCHTTAPTNPAASHQNGTFDASIGSDDTVLPEVNLAGTVGFIDGATPTCGPNGGLIACHRDSNYTVVRNGTAVTAAWARLWSNTADNTGGNPDERCQNCHGTYFTAQSWRAGVIHKAGAPDMLAKHGSASTSCNDCHAYNDGAVYTQTYITGAHGNGSITMNDNAAGTYTGWARGTGLDAQKSNCAQCHAGFADATYYFSKTWTNTQEVAGHGVTTVCGECHAGGTRPGVADSGAHNAHGAGDAQLVAGGAACVPCHGNNGGALFQTTPAGTHGIGNAVNFAATMVYSTAVRNDLTGTCSGALACHVSSGTNIQWGQTQVGTNDCKVCHQGTADINNFAWTGTAGNISKINITEYSAAGHGSANGIGTTNCMGCHDISQPHVTTSDLSGGTGNPFRLKNLGGTGPNSFNCSNTTCHPTATATNETALGLTYGSIQNHERANFPAPQVDTWYFLPKCVDCHDPHGDSVSAVNNVKMISNDVWDKGSGANWVPTNYSTIGNNQLTFSVYTTGQNTAGTAYADSDIATVGGEGGICQECHELNGGAVADPDMTSYLDNTRRGSPATGTADVSPHPAAPGDCSACHKHDSGFKPSGCNGCHGGHDAAAASKNFWPDGITITIRPNRPGEHAKHIDQLIAKLGPTYVKATLTDEQQKTLCRYCHTYASDVGESLHDDATSPADVDSFNRIWNATADGAPLGTYLAGGEATNGICDNVDCHNNQTTTPNYDWYDGAISACLMCHTKGGTNTATAAHPTSGLHNMTVLPAAAHDESFHTSGLSTCTTCHLSASMAMSPAQTHINGSSLASGDFLAANVWLNAGTGATQIGTYTEATSGNSRGTCGGTTSTGSLLGTGGSCHSDKGNWARKWSTDANADHRVNTAVTAAVCTVCHGTLNNWAVGMTVNHNNGTINNGAQHSNCETCHVLPNSPYLWATHHDSATHQIETNSNAQIGYNATTGSCTNTCHATAKTMGAGPSSIWVNNGLAGKGASCTSCHGYPPTSANDGGTNWDLDATGMEAVKHDSQIAGNTTALRANHDECGICHGVKANAAKDGFLIEDVVPLQGSHAYVVATDHKNGSITMNDDSNAVATDDANYNSATGGCANAACHSDDVAHRIVRMTGAIPPATTSLKQPIDIGPGSCVACHGDNVSGAAWPDAVAGNNSSRAAYADDQTGAHLTHINAIVGSGATVAVKNTACNRCHPNPGSPRTGSTDTGHSNDVAPTGIVDVYKDGRTDSGTLYFKNVAGVNDTDATYNNGTRVCSNVNCHGNQVTLAWIDTVAPGTTSTLAAAVGTAVGTVNLTWTAPGDDGTTGTAVAYDVRYSGSIINTDGLFTAATPAAGAPIPLQAGTSQSMTVTGLTPGATYFFCLKARDDASPTPLWSAISNSTSAVAFADTAAPVFGGITSATNTGAGGSVNLAWSAATDATLPITYRIWVSETTPIVFTGAYSYTTQGLDYQVTTGLTNGTLYYFGVRAADAAAPNVSTNTEEASATPSAGGFPPGNPRQFWLGQNTGTAVFTGLSTNLTATCGTATTAIFPAAPTPPSTTGFNAGIPILRGLLNTAVGVCASAAGNNSSNSTLFSTSRRWGQAFYYNTAYTATTTRVCGAESGNNFAFRAALATDLLNIWFTAVQNSSTYTLSANPAAVPISTNALFAAAPDLSNVCVDVPNGWKFGVLFDWQVVGTGVATRNLVGHDGNATVNRPTFFVTESPNNPPAAITVTAPTAGTYSGNLNIAWNTVADPDGHTVHYDVYGSTDSGATFPYVIATDLAAGPATWDTSADNIGKTTANAAVRVKVVAGDQYNLHNAGTQSVTITVNNTSAYDPIEPGPITLAAATSLTPGGVNLTWNATGDDGAVGRATSYDIRYSTAAISSDLLFTSATQVTGEPLPQTSGTAESFTVGGLTPGSSYFFAIKAGDDKTPTANFGALSNSPPAIAGANCGVCHGMPPTNAATGGGHLVHASVQADCGDCHGTPAATYTSAHSNGSLELGWKTAAPPGLVLPRTSLAITFTQSATTIYSDAGGGGGVDTFTGSDNIDNGTCSGFNLVTGCHPSGKTAIWGGTTGCVTCHGYPPTTGSTHANGSVNHSAANITLEHDECSFCHGLKGTGGVAAPKSPMIIMPTTTLGGGQTYVRATHHVNGSTELNGDNAGTGSNAGYAVNSGWCSTGKCHGGNATHDLVLVSGSFPTPVGKNLLELGSGSCEGCHNGTDLGGIAGTIKLGSPHTKKSRTSGGVTTAAVSCMDCHPGGAKGATHSKNADSSVVVIPNYTAVGGPVIASGHVVDGTTSGIVLGGDVTTGQTEAEICWNCHSPTAGTVPNGQEVSEWGTNTDTNATSPNYNFGTLDAPSWFSGTWTSAKFVHKTGLLSSKPATPKTIPTGTVAGGGSVHTANPAGAPWNGPTAPSGTAQIDTVGQVRCSYCHNVHSGTNGGGSVGKPFLRGTWKGNPYREDGAPRTTAEEPTHTYANRANFGPVPRGNASANEYGGFQIDQNNGSPAATWTVANSAGLCALCHGGTGTDWNQFSSPTTPAQDWSSGLNSHRAVVAGETATSYFNLFGGARRHPSVAPYPTVQGSSNSYYRTAPWQAYMQVANSPAPYGFRGRNAYKMTPTLSNSSPYGQKSYNWGATVDYATVNTNYHRFSCSKCHNPHASRLPRLLISNCLDTKVNTWEDSFMTTGNTIYTLENRNVKNSNLTAAENCHRRRDPAFAVPAWTGMPASDGWNNVSPW